MKVLITGGAGFIGSHLAEACCRRGWRVVILDNLSLGTRENLEWAGPQDRLELVEGDIMDADRTRACLEGCTLVFHHAALPSVPFSVREPEPTNRANLDASLQLLVAARTAGVRRFLFASSSAIYGDSPELPKHEELPPNPLSPYALQKYAAEKYGQLFHRLYGMETVSFRYFNVFGPRQSFDSPYSGVIARFCADMLHGRPPMVFGDGRQTRDFTYISNVIAANLAAATAPAKDVAGRVFNIAGGLSISLLDLIETINQLTGQNLQPEFRPPREGDVRHSQAAIAAATAAIDFHVWVDWKEGLYRTLEFYRRHPARP